MMENNNNGKGIFYGVIGIATLIVAIIGATFAYFTASARSNETAINVTSFSGFSVSLNVSKVAPTSAVDKLIPLDVLEPKTQSLLPNALDGNSESGLCIDNNGDQVCAVYRLDILNTSTQVELSGVLEAAENNYTTTNLKYQMYTSADEKAFTALGNVVNVPTKGVDITTLPKLTVASGTDDDTVLTVGEGTADRPATSTLYLVIWLEDTGADQNEDLGKNFMGRITFNAVTGTGGTLQATFGTTAG